MTLRVLAVSTLAASLFAGASSAEEEAVWLRDLDAAKRSHRDILIVFTGKECCFPCQLLERDDYVLKALTEAGFRALPTEEVFPCGAA
jgi:thioredoxin-related protein